MAFPSTVGTKPDTLASAWEGARHVAASIKTQAVSVRDRSAAGSIGSSVILNFATALAEAKARFAIYSAVPGLGAYAQAQVNDPALDVVAEFNAMVARLDALRDWIIANFPKDAGNYLLAVQFNAEGRTVDRQFTTAQLAAFRTELDALIATID